MAGFGMPDEDYPVTAVTKTVFDAMKDAAQHGYIDVGQSFSVAGQTYSAKGSAMEYLTAAAGVAPGHYAIPIVTGGSAFGGAVISLTGCVVSVIVVNGLDAPIRRSDDYCNWGCAVGRPVEQKVDGKGHPVLDGEGKPVLRNHDEIPGKTTIDGVETYGIGLFRTKQSSIFHGNDGAYALTSAATGFNTTVGVGWSNAPFADVGFGLTTDLSTFGPLQAFYFKTADQGRIKKNMIECVTDKIGTGINLSASIVRADGAYSVTNDHMVITLVFETAQ